MATRAWKTAQPSEIIIWRPRGSRTCSLRLRSAQISSASCVRTNFHGWVLWIDGARIARIAARCSNAAVVETVVVVMTPPLEIRTGRALRRPRNGHSDLGPEPFRDDARGP